MKLGILGSGRVGQTLAAKLAEVGQDVMVGTRSPAKLKEWLAQHPAVKAGTYDEAAAFGDMLFNVTPGHATLDVLRSLEPAHLDGKILIDVANPLDFSQGMPPRLFVVNTDSLGEQVQRAFPETRVVKALNTLTAALMVDPGSLAGGDHTLFLSGDDADAKARVAARFAEWFGWRDILDVGDITTARGTEALLLIWVRLMQKFGTGNFQFKIVR